MRLGVPPAVAVRRLPTGLAALDELLGGGLPRGYLSEIAGGPSSGRTALLNALLASATARGELAAVVDVLDAVDPPSLARAGADLARVLWVRPPAVPAALKCAELILGAGGFALVALDLGVGDWPSAPAMTARHGGDPADMRPYAHAAMRRAASGIPWQAWLRLARAARNATAVALACVPQRLTGTAAAVALSLTCRRPHWSAGLFDGLTVAAAIARNRIIPTPDIPPAIYDLTP